MLVTNLSDEIAKVAKTADEMWVAVGLLNTTGLSQVQAKLRKNCMQHFLVGIDLPTEPKALHTLLRTGADVKVYDAAEYFHPKMYLFRTGTTYQGFVGSANCTNGGLVYNVELSFRILDKNSCEQLLKWFVGLFDDAQLITPAFLAEYETVFIERTKRKNEGIRLVKKAKRVLREEAAVFLTGRRDFIAMLKAYRKRRSYASEKASKEGSVEQIRVTLDFANNFKNIDVDAFFSIWDLGHLIAIPKPTIKREIKTFAAMLKMLCDERIDIALRYERALNGDLSLKGIGENLISKVLAVHKPDTYFVKNGKSERALQQFGLVFPGGLSKGQKYKATCQYLVQVCKEADIDNLTVLDYYLYLEAGGENV